MRLIGMELFSYAITFLYLLLSFFKLNLAIANINFPVRSMQVSILCPIKLVSRVRNFPFLQITKIGCFYIFSRGYQLKIQFPARTRLAEW